MVLCVSVSVFCAEIVGELAAGDFGVSSSYIIILMRL